MENNETPNVNVDGKDGSNTETTPTQTQNTPFAVFPDEHSFMSRVNREANKSLKATAVELGFESVDALKEAVKGYKESSLNSVTKEQFEEINNNLNTSKQEKDQLLNQYNSLLKNTEAKMNAMALGVKPERVDYLLKLANLDGIEVIDGKVDSEAIKASLEEVLNNLPELRITNSTGRSGGDFSQSGNYKSTLTMEDVYSMSPSEYNSRREEILQFMKKQNK